ncbi:MFS transporter [Streptacidiphilus griseoplanus]|uniref:MFS transporter n=1 Tax=Peterkaempfera griseoplana TaxID=66896 RepID=UPI0006E417C6|nr:MFS transporter [Peterkaempfera griseoplana]
MNSSPAPGAHKWATLTIGCVAQLVLAVDMTALHLAIPGLTRDLDPSATQILWIADSYGFALAGLLVTMGWLGDRIGRRRLLLIGTGAFGLASAMTAYADSAAQLIAARALLGVAGATIMPSTLSLIRNVFTDARERTTAVGIASGVAGAGVGLGPVIGGALLDHFWWGSVFLVNLPVMAVLLVAGLLVLPESRNPRPGRLDLPSVPLSVLGVLGLVYAVKEAARAGAGQPRVAVAAVAGLLALVVFVRRQRRLDHPLIDLRLLGSRAFSGSVGANLVAMFALVAQSLIFAQYFQQVLGWSPLVAGLAGLPGAVAAMAGGGLAGPLIGVMGRARVVALGMAVAACGFVLYTLTGTVAHYPVMVLAMLPVGLGMGFTFAVTTDTMLAAVPRERAGAASAISETGNELGGALGMAVLGSVLGGVYRGGLRLPDGLPGGTVAAARDSLGGALQAAAGAPAGLAGRITDAARHAFVGGMHTAALCSAALAAVVAVAVLFALRGVPNDIPEQPEPADQEAPAAAAAVR